MADRQHAMEAIEHWVEAAMVRFGVDESHIRDIVEDSIERAESEMAERLVCPEHGGDVDRLMVDGGELCAHLVAGGAYCRLPMVVAHAAQEDQHA